MKISPLSKEKMAEIQAKGQKKIESEVVEGDSRNTTVSASNRDRQSKKGTRHIG
jgi:hypothetical protein